MWVDVGELLGDAVVLAHDESVRDGQDELFVDTRIAYVIPMRIVAFCCPDPVGITR